LGGRLGGGRLFAREVSTWTQCFGLETLQSVVDDRHFEGAMIRGGIRIASSKM
jgi:hypothetical protein